MKSPELILAEILAEIGVGVGDISTLAKYIAVDADGSVYTWGNKPKMYDWMDTESEREWITDHEGVFYNHKSDCLQHLGIIEDFDPEIPIENYCFPVGMVGE